MVDVTKRLLTGIVGRPGNEAKARLWDAYVEALASPAGKEILAKYELGRSPTRLAMILAGQQTLRDVIPFPKTNQGVELMSGAPVPIAQSQLDEVGIQSTVPPPKGEG